MIRFPWGRWLSAALLVVVPAACAAGLAVGPRPAARAQPAPLTPQPAPARSGWGGALSSRPHPRAVLAATRSSPAPRPSIVQRPIPFGARRKAEMQAYARRHYGLDTYHLVDPQVIVEHYTQTPDFASTYNTFASDVPDTELHELPNTCAHFVVDADGTIYQLVPVSIMCRHTVGLNWTAIGIEMVGTSDAQILGRHTQLRSSLALTRWLRCLFRIRLQNVIGHNESLSSPYHHERVVALRRQTHGDWVHADMQIYRAKLAALGACA